MQSGISIISETTYEPKPRRSIDPATFESQSFLPPKPAVVTITNSAGVLPYSKTPTGYARLSRSSSNVREEVSSPSSTSTAPTSGIAVLGDIFCHPSNSNNNINNTKLNFEFNLEDHIRKTRQAAKYLKQIIHSKDCLNQKCSHGTCAKTRQILFHVNECEMHKCNIPGCQTTRRLLDHSKQCHNSWHKIHGTTTAQQDFCLLCTIAYGNDEENQQQQRSLQRQPSYSYEDTEIYQLNDKDAQLLPMISHEIIDFSRVPFQAYPLVPLERPRSSTLTHSDSSSNLLAYSSPRAKTFSDSNFEVSNEPNKKQRSKSWAVPSPPFEMKGNSISNDPLASSPRLTLVDNGLPRGLFSSGEVSAAIPIKYSEELQESMIKSSSEMEF